MLDDSMEAFQRRGFVADDHTCKLLERLSLSDIQIQIDTLNKLQDKTSLELQKVVSGHTTAFISAVSEAHQLSSLGSFLKSGFSSLQTSINKLSRSIPTIHKQNTYPSSAPPSFSTQQSKQSRKSLRSSLQTPTDLFIGDPISVKIVQERFTEAVKDIQSAEKYLQSKMIESKEVNEDQNQVIKASQDAISSIKFDLVPILTDFLRSFCAEEAALIMSQRFDDDMQTLPPSPWRNRSTSLSLASVSKSHHHTRSDIVALLNSLGHLSRARETVLTSFSNSCKIFLTNSRLSSAFFIPSTTVKLLSPNFELLTSLYWSTFKACRLIHYATFEAFDLSMLSSGQSKTDKQRERLVVAGWQSATLRSLINEVVKGHQMSLISDPFHLLTVVMSVIMAVNDASIIQSVKNDCKRTSMTFQAISIIKKSYESTLFDCITSSFQSTTILINLDDFLPALSTVNSWPFDQMKQDVFVPEFLLNYLKILNVIIFTIFKSNPENVVLLQVLNNLLVSTIRIILNGLTHLLKNNSINNFDLLLAFFSSIVTISCTIPSMIDFYYENLAENSEIILFEELFLNYFACSDAVNSIFGMEGLSLTFQDSNRKVAGIHDSLVLSAFKLVEMLISSAIYDSFDWGQKLVDFCEPLPSIDGLSPSICAKKVVIDFRYTLTRIPRFQVVSLYIFRRTIQQLFMNFNSQKFISNFNSPTFVAVTQLAIDLNFLKTAFWSLLPEDFNLDEEIIQKIQRNYLQTTIKDGKAKQFVDSDFIESKISNTLKEFFFPDLTS
ncbi:hypothetical protein RCL1_001843 [Eukaryota sp. TZLM3-RCL]